MSVNGVDNDDDLMPTGCAPLTHQVAGHFHGNKRTRLGLLQSIDGYVLKAVQSPPRGLRELEFFKKIFNSDDLSEDEVALRDLIPRYHSEIVHNDVSYIKMEDVAYGIQKPSVIDFKIGRITHDPEATADKISRQKLKYPPAENIGFQLMGMRVYDPSTDTFTRYDKLFGRSRRQEDMLHCLGLFYQFNEHAQKNAVKETIKKLNFIKCWFEKQTIYNFFASSILIVYESNLERMCEKKDAIDDQHCSYSTQLVRAKMCDLTHVFPTDNNNNSNSNNKTIDENYLFGLNCLIEHLEALLKEDYVYQDPRIRSLIDESQS